MLMGAAALAADIAMRMVPTGPWSVGYDGGMCVLSRPFGNTRAPVTLEVRRVPLSRAGELMMMQPASGEKSFMAGEALLRFDPVIEPVTASFRSGVALGTNVRMSSIFLVRADDGGQDLRDLLRGATRIEVAMRDRGKTQTLSFGQIGGAAASNALGDCERQMLALWGADPAILANTAVPAKPMEDPGRWVPVNSYPAEARRRFAEGVTTMLWSIDVAGRATACKVVVSSNNAALDKASCAGVSQARYAPARDAQGRPVNSYVTHRVVWKLRSGLPGR